MSFDKSFSFEDLNSIIRPVRPGVTYNGVVIMYAYNGLDLFIWMAHEDAEI